MGYTPYYNQTDGALAGAMIFGIILLIIVFLIGIAMYILFSLGLMKMAQNRGLENPWLAWIPIGNFYLAGKLLDNVDIATYNVNKLELVLPIALIGSGLFSAIPLLGQLISLAVFIFMIFVAIKFAKMYAPENYVLYTVLTVLFSPIMFFVLKNKVAVEVPAIGKPIFDQGGTGGPGPGYGPGPNYGPGPGGPGTNAGPTDPGPSAGPSAGPTDPSNPTNPY